MKQVHQEEIEHILRDYREAVDVIVASFSNAISDVGEPGRHDLAPAQRYLLASVAGALEQLAASVSVSVNAIARSSRDCGEFKSRFEGFRSGLATKFDLFKKLLSGGAA